MELKRLLTRANALLLLGAYQGAESFIEQAMAEADKLKQELDELDTLRNRILEMASEIERLNSAWQVETLNRKDSIIANQEEEKDRLKSENAHLQSVIDEANAQEPVKGTYWRDGSGVFTQSPMDSDLRLYLKPIPAQQSPEVAVPDQIDEDLIFEIMEIPISYGSADGVKYVYPSREESIAIIKALRAIPSPRITEQDAQELGASLMDFIMHISHHTIDADKIPSDWVASEEGLAILNKLNGDENGK